MSNKLPVPKDARHKKFADLVLGGTRPQAAYKKAGFKVTSTQSAQAAASRLLKNVTVLAYMEAVRQASAAGVVLSVQEKREFLARIVRTPITDLKPEETGSANNDLIKKWVKKFNVVSGGEDMELCTETLEKLCPLKAIEMDNKLSGDDPDANAVTALAEAFAQLAQNASTLPTDRM